MARRTVYFVSDQTGVTAEQLGHSMLAQFGGIEIKAVTLPFIDTADRAKKVAEIIDRTAETHGRPPLVFSTPCIPDVRGVVHGAHSVMVDVLDAAPDRRGRVRGPT